VVKRLFPSDICTLIEPTLTYRPSHSNETGALDEDWEFVSCRLATEGSRILVVLRAAGRESTLDQSSDPYLHDEVHIEIDVNDLDVLNGRALGMDIPDLVIEALSIFTRQASPDEVPGMIRLPGWEAE
jgi:hypothetical protein